MTKEELLLQYNNITSELEDLAEKRLYTSRKFNNLWKEQKQLAIEINKLNHCYWDRQDWIYDAINEIPARPELTGNILTEYYAQELNKLNGVLLEKQDDEDGTINYTVSVITPYSIYEYRLNRGYNGQCNLHKDNFSCSNSNKCKARVTLCENHICELVYEETLEELRTRWERNILDK